MGGAFSILSIAEYLVTGEKFTNGLTLSQRKSAESMCEYACGGGG
jgi:hypothetical protein